ncbi:hypothetical protein A2960_04005 [Candidatus Gottesmanbacteria bacterium RIFCSPLOWO2_01_FULL_39_12b]|uniref:Glycosyltransferase 2-like domain-containing protein n=1 Tax=Candidatus Gottesmanbacteria bacterium RIFCSPLOWO2_01_FULL_39_12b TaxID=1798388 RepID=A0A1F6AN47_9BACT|nr:MAG: hypothetical protein A2960_04005 [Candidatus Gottesmanbacteria bacterium RIFCSPLOWO2_01_FULL_39_12b]
MYKISILSAVYQNEENIIELVESLYQRVVKPLKKEGILVEVIIAEDGSTDNTRAILQRLKKKYGMKLLLGKKRLGCIKAVKNLYSKASGELIFFWDGDGEVQPVSFWDLYSVFKKGNFDAVVAYKQNRKPRFRYLISRINNLVLRILFHVRIRDANAGFRLYKARIGKELVRESNFLKYNFNSEQIIRATKYGYKIGDVGVTHFARESMMFKPDRMVEAVLLAFWELVRFKISPYRS